MAFNSSSSEISEKLARLGRRPESHDLSILAQKVPSLPRFPTTPTSTLPGFERQCKQELYMHYTISTDRSGTQDQVASSILSVLGSKQAKWGGGEGGAVEAGDLAGAESGVQEDLFVQIGSLGKRTSKKSGKDTMVVPLDLDSQPRLWEKYQGMIMDLYANHDFSVKRIAEFMQQDYGLQAQPETYMSKLTDWAMDFRSFTGVVVVPTDAWWDLHKPIISDLYLRQKRNPSAIADILLDEHYANRFSSYNCEDHLKRWGIWKGDHANPFKNQSFHDRMSNDAR